MLDPPKSHRQKYFLFSKPTQNSKIRPWTARVSICRPIWFTFGMPFSRPPNRSKTYVFSPAFLGRTFRLFFTSSSTVVDFGTPFKIQWAPKSTQSAERLKNNACNSPPSRTPVFSRNHMNYCAVGPQALLKDLFSGVASATFCFYVFFPKQA